jgi:hypothetical protein
MLIVSQGTSPSTERALAKSEAKDTLQTNLETGMRGALEQNATRR